MSKNTNDHCLLGPLTGSASGLQIVESICGIVRCTAPQGICAGLFSDVMGSHKCVDNQSIAQSQPHARQSPRLSSRRPSSLQQRLKGRSLSRSNCRCGHHVVCAGKQWDTGCKFVGCGSSAPEAVLTNKDLEKLVETDDEWIATRTGIRKRHILGKDETLSDHAARSAQQALDMAGISAEEVDLIILATSSPDDLFGSACRVSMLYCRLTVTFSA